MERRQKYLDAMGYVRTEKHSFIGSNEREIWETMVPDQPDLRHELLMGYRAYRRLHPIPFRELMNPQIPDLFRELKRRGLRIGIASSSAAAAILQLTEAAGVAGVVDCALSGEECTAHKPDPEIYLRVLEHIGLCPQEAIAVEDSPAGIMAAKNAGVSVLALKPVHYLLDQSQADLVIENLFGVCGYIEEQNIYTDEK